MSAVTHPARWLTILVVLCGVLLALCGISLMLWGAVMLVGTAARADWGVDTTMSDHPILHAVYADHPPKLDGLLDDSLWTYATRLDNFYVPDLDRVPSESTIVWLACDSAHFYFAARMYDRHPDQVHMEEIKRDGQIWADDWIAVGLDVQHLHYGNPYGFAVTPRGTQYTQMPDGSPSKVEWRGDWEAAARIDSLGWTVEMVVPMSIFRRPAGERTIGVFIQRYLAHTKEDIRWPNMGRNFDYTKSGDWVGVVWPHVRGRPAVMPYGVGESERGNPNGYAGVDVRYTTSAGVTLLGTAYPDFKNVESDILGLDFSYSPLYAGDNRPFFKEGKGYLPWDWVFYSGHVGEMYGGGKAFGQYGKHRLGLLSAYDRSKVAHIAGRWNWQPRTRMDVYQQFAYRHGPKDAPRPDDVPMATDHLSYLTTVQQSRQVGNSQDYYKAQFGLTRTASDTGNGFETEASYERYGGSGSLGFGVVAQYLSDGFLLSQGTFDPQDAGQRNVAVGVNYWLKRADSWLEQYGWSIHGHYSQRLDGDLYFRHVNLSGWIETSRNISTWLAFFAQDRPPNKDRTVGFWVGWNQNKLYDQGSISATVGRMKSADYLLLYAGQGTHIGSYIILRGNGEFRRFDYPVGHADKPSGGVEDRYQVIGTIQFNITSERSVSGRIVKTNDGLNGYATYQQTLRRGLDLFVIVGDPSADTWTKRVALKAMFVL